MTDKLIRVRAWSSGKAYNKPSRLITSDKIRTIVIFDGNICLAKFRFRSIKEYESGIKIVKKSMRSTQ